MPNLCDFCKEEECEDGCHECDVRWCGGCRYEHDCPHEGKGEPMKLRYIVRLMRGERRLASMPCEGDDELLEIVRDLLDNTLDMEDHIEIKRMEVVT